MDTGEDPWVMDHLSFAAAPSIALRFRALGAAFAKANENGLRDCKLGTAIGQLPWSSRFILN
ncbi:hypothetical protein RDI58_000771 [Solanum bulbocastanum]|uniref:Uncharacterized protein n=1 Tax=Solanum bulbocastanum TaxID=147425 RepID=A0AAN8U1U4_SOLBU